MVLDQILFETKVLLGHVELTLTDYSDLQIGDVVVLDQKAGDFFEIQIEEETRFLGSIGLYETKKAVIIT